MFHGLMNNPVFGLLITWQTDGNSAGQEIPMHFTGNKQCLTYSNNNLTMDPLPCWSPLHGRKAVDLLN